MSSKQHRFLDKLDVDAGFSALIDEKSFIGI
jgi:hypothetical protein